MKRRLLNAWHNIIIHPIAGVLWLFGFQRAGDWVHGAGPDVRAKIIVANITPEQAEKIRAALKEFAATRPNVKLSDLMVMGDDGELAPVSKI